MLNCLNAITKIILSRSTAVTRRNYGTKTYEGEGKTTLNILNNEEGLGLMINGFSQAGFRLNNDITVLGPMIIFPRTVLSWTVADIHDINEDSLCLLPIIEPKIDLLVLGIGDNLRDFSFYKRIAPFMKKHRLNIEILATDQACSTFNFLNSEGRWVVGAMIPPRNLIPTDNDILESKIRYQNLYEVD